jgi:hypothetical protein
LGEAVWSVSTEQEMCSSLWVSLVFYK